MTLTEVAQQSEAGETKDEAREGEEVVAVAVAEGCSPVANSESILKRNFSPTKPAYGPDQARRLASRSLPHTSIRRGRSMSISPLEVSWC
jgi:hypothetical protein